MGIQRRFLTNEDLSDKILHNNLDDKVICSIEEIEQGYIKFDPEVLITNVNNQEFYLTYKKIGKLQRRELEERISREQYQILLEAVKGRIIKKTRFYIALDNELSAKIDVYNEELDGLITVDTEFKTIDAASNFIVPSWYGPEVTDDKRFKNKSLAKADNDDIQKLITKTIPKKNMKALKR